MRTAWLQSALQSAHGVVAINIYPEPIRFMRDLVTTSIAPSPMGSSRKPVQGTFLNSMSSSSLWRRPSGFSDLVGGG
jgi:hypothetical protein